MVQVAVVVSFCRESFGRKRIFFFFALLVQNLWPINFCLILSVSWYLFVVVVFCGGECLLWFYFCLCFVNCAGRKTFCTCV